MTVSIRPSTFVEGGIVPVDKNLTWKECRFVLFDYTRKDGSVAATTTAAKIVYHGDDGEESIQHYSVGDPKRFQPSADGKTLVGEGALSKSSNYYLLMNSLINAGFPENRLDADISVLDGLYAHHIGMPEPKRSGLTREPQADGQPARERVISVPDQILKLPWENKKGASKATTATGKGKAEEADPTEDAIAIVTELVSKADGGSVKRQQVATAAIRGKKQAVAGFVFKPEFVKALEEAGFAVDGEEISLA